MLSAFRATNKPQRNPRLTPAHAGPAFAHSDPVLLEQMVRNLVGNALRYTQQGGVLVGGAAAHRIG